MNSRLSFFFLTSFIFHLPLALIFFEYQPNMTPSSNFQYEIEIHEVKKTPSPMFEKNLDKKNLSKRSPQRRPSSPSHAVGAQAKGNIRPTYPMLSVEFEEEGEVIVEAHIGKDGIIQKVLIKKSSGFFRLDQAAISAVKNTSFSPAYLKSQPIGGVKELHFKFQLKDI